MNAAETATISRNSTITISLAISIIVGAVGFALYSERRWNKIEAALVDMNHALTSLSINPWTLTEQSEWAARLQLYNPELRVPDPKNNNLPFEVTYVSKSSSFSPAD